MFDQRAEQLKTAQREFNDLCARFDTLDSWEMLSFRVSDLHVSLAAYINILNIDKDNVAEMQDYNRKLFQIINRFIGALHDLFHRIDGDIDQITQMLTTKRNWKDRDQYIVEHDKMVDFYKGLVVIYNAYIKIGTGDANFEVQPMRHISYAEKVAKKKDSNDG